MEEDHANTEKGRFERKQKGPRESDHHDNLEDDGQGEAERGNHSTSRTV